MVDRYEMYYDSFDNCVAADVEECGGWVDYDDYQAQAARIEHLEAALETARNDALREAADHVNETAKSWRENNFPQAALALFDEAKLLRALITKEKS